MAVERVANLHPAITVWKDEEEAEIAAELARFYRAAAQVERAVQEAERPAD